MKLHRNRRSCV